MSASAATSTTNPVRVLWGTGGPRTLRAHWALHELGLDYQTAAMKPRESEAASAKLLQVTGRRKIPVLQDGGFTIGQSAAIVTYLSDAYGTEKDVLLPRDLFARARAMEWCHFIMSELDATSLYVIRRHHTLEHIYGAAPNALLAARQYFLDQLEAVDRQLCADTHYLMGEQFTLPDILLASCLLWARKEDLDLGARCNSYLQRVTTRPAYQRACAANMSGARELLVAHSRPATARL